MTMRARGVNLVLRLREVFGMLAGAAHEHPSSRTVLLRREIRRHQRSGAANSLRHPTARGQRADFTVGGFSGRDAFSPAAVLPDAGGGTALSIYPAIL